MSATELDVVITALGAAGDGIATAEGRRLFVPGALPGEHWRVRLDDTGDQAQPLTCLVPVERAEPPCRHFGHCGGCRLQHLTADTYASFKRQRILDALARQGLATACVTDVRIGPIAGRRRLRLALTRSHGCLRLGMRERSGHAVAPLETCTVADPALAGLLMPLAEALGDWLERPWATEASLTLTDGGPDLLLHASREPQQKERTGAAAMAASLGLARIAWQTAAAPPEALITLRPPVVRLSGTPVELPPGAFLQATAFGEGELTEAVAGWSEGAKSVADLYAGVGTLTLALAGWARRLLACESDSAAVAALRRVAGGRNVTVAQRDLVRRPLQPVELDHDLVALDPPRAGAAAQCVALARSRIPRVIYASCRPESFARDARTLVDAGFALAEVRPIDQFRFSAEIELVALFIRATARGKRP